MPSRRRKNKKLPIVDNHWMLWGMGLWVGLPAAILMPMAYGADAYGIGLGLGTLAGCIGMGYAIRFAAHRLID